MPRDGTIGSRGCINGLRQKPRHGKLSRLVRPYTQILYMFGPILDSESAHANAPVVSNLRRRSLNLHAPQFACSVPLLPPTQTCIPCCYIPFYPLSKRRRQTKTSGLLQ